MKQPSTQAGLHRVVALVALIVLLVGPSAASLPSQQTPNPKTPYADRYENWSRHPAPAQSEQPGTSKPLAQANSETMEETSSDPLNQNTQIVYEHYDYNKQNWNISETKIGYGSSGLLIKNDADDFYPRYGAKGKQIVFVSNRTGNDEIFRANVNYTVGHTYQLTKHRSVDTMPAMNPDGNKVAFVSNRTQNPEIFTMNADGSGVRQLTHSENVDIDPDWSPNGEQIAWVRAVDETYGKIYVMNADGTNPHAITPPLRLVGRPIWSPAGDRLTFQYDALFQDGWLEVGTVSADGSHLKMIYIDRKRFVEDFLSAGWTPKGDCIVFNRVNYYKTKLGYVIEQSEFGWVNVESLEVNSFKIIGLAGVIDNAYSQFRLQPAPVSSINHLAEYSPATGFKIYYNIKSSYPAYDFRIQTTTDPSAGWTDWVHETAYNCYTLCSKEKWYQGIPGQKVYFRIQARDDAGIEESPHETPDAWTTLYDWRKTGQVMDARNYPVGSVQIHTEPPSLNRPETDVTGNATLYFGPDQESILASFERPGYGVFPTQTWQRLPERNFLAYLPPVSSLIQNGSFEDPAGALSKWQVEGTLPAQSLPGHSGQGIRLGKPCEPAPCVEPQELGLALINSTSRVNWARVDSQGGMHVIYDGRMYLYRSPEGVWSPPQDSISDPNYIYFVNSQNAPVAVTIDRNDTLHLVISGDRNIFYVSKPVGQPWSAPVSIGKHSNALAIAADEQGTLYSMYEVYPINSNYYGFELRTRLPSGEWLDPVKINNGGFDQYIPSFAIATNGDGLIHVAFRKAGIKWAYYAVYTKQGDFAGVSSTFSYNIDALPQNDQGISLQLGKDGAVHLLIEGVSPIYYVRQPDGKLQTPIVMSNLADARNLTLSPNGDVFAVASGSSPAGAIQLLYKRPGEPEFSVHPFASTLTLNNSVVATGDDSIPRLILSAKSGVYYQTLSVAGVTEKMAIHQIIAVPADLHQPTLALFMQFHEFGIANGTKFNAVVTPLGGESQALPLHFTEGSWQHAWADLSAWAGQTIDLRLEFVQAQGDPIADVLLDEVSVGAWTTPIIQSITPKYNPSSFSDTYRLQITGDNLMEGAQVYIGDQQVSIVERDPQTGYLFVLPPDGFAIGRYDVRVVNPGGADAVLPKGFVVGLSYFLSSILNSH